MGREFSDHNYIGTYHLDRHANVDFFKEDWNEMTAVRVSQALAIKVYPLPEGSPFNTQSWVRLKQLGVDAIWSIVDKATTKLVKEVLGRRVFGSKEAQDLPRLRLEDQFKHIIYIDWVEHQRSGNGLYTGSATGECGAAGRIFTYEQVAGGRCKNRKERKGLHLKVALEKDAIMRLRPLMIFDDDVPQSIILMLEGLTMDFLGTIDRSSDRTIRMGGGAVLHNAAMLEATKQAFPSKRRQPDFKGLNAVSALRQAGAVKLPNGTCPFSTFYCIKKPCLIVAANGLKVVCEICYKL